MLHQLEPRYHPPNRHTLSEKLIPALLAQEKVKLQTGGEVGIRGDQGSKQLKPFKARQ